ncbi:DUF2207 domain-containing protein [Cryobacterium cryoconiti]|uniref:DUF2207 domain-containing protein n=1 Tax=Cryobacterium cryoconiti TaxID=1259239 RepID=UPI00157F9755|nr:DUF2207 domain-containing protein [Cryobacterium cryoconiti]
MQGNASTRQPLRRLAQVMAGLAVTALLALGMPLVANAGTGDFTFTSFEADYYLSRDDAGHSTLRTVETFVAEFPDFDQNRGIVRVIPNDYDGVPLNTTVQSVTDAAGAPVSFEVIDQGDSLELPLGTDDFVRGTQTYVIEYTQQNVVRAFADTQNDEFYWDTNGTGFDQPFGSVTARVHVDPSVTEFLTGDTACYSGGQGDTTACPVTDAASPDFGAMFTSTVQGLGPRQNVSVAIGFAPGTFLQVPATAGGSSDSGDGDKGIPALVLQILVLLVCVLGAVAAGIRRLFARRDARGRGTIIAQYSVPEGYNLLEAADLVGRPKTAVAAQLVSFAVRGNVRILDYPVSDSSAEYTLQLLSVDGVDTQERELLATLFSGLTVGAVRELGTVDKILARQLTDLRPATRRLVTSRGGRVKATSPAGKGILKAMYIVAGIGVAGVVLVSIIDWAWPLIGVIPFCLLMGVFIGVAEFFGRSQFVLTDAGAEQRDYLKGMKVYLELAEEERFRMLQSPEGALRVTVPAAVPGQATVGSAAPDTLERVKLYEKLLPFAVLWGVEREWAKELVFLYEQGAPEPSWYGSQNGFSSRGFGNALGHMAGAVATSSTLPHSSGGGIGGGSFSGGSFGGGFSGGGGGGGGGGGR